ncbi:hypothetical protein [Aurantivibrio plasticivorans]
MKRSAKYPLAPALTKIVRHDALPNDAVLLGTMLDSSDGNDELYSLVGYQNHLTVLVSYNTGPNNTYYCDQFDFPLRALAWFPQALDEFRKSPSEGGLHAGAMISTDTDIDGEMLAVGSTTSGYAITNWSRNQQNPVGDYDPAELSLSWTFLYELGFLDLWKSLGEKYERGEI